MVYCFYCLNTSKQKCIDATPTIVSLKAVVRSCHTTPSLPRWRERVAWRDQITVAKESAYYLFSNREKKLKIILLPLAASKIWLHVICNLTTKSKLKLCICILYMVYNQAVYQYNFELVSMVSLFRFPFLLCFFFIEIKPSLYRYLSSNEITTQHELKSKYTLWTV